MDRIVSDPNLLLVFVGHLLVLFHSLPNVPSISAPCYNGAYSQCKSHVYHRAEATVGQVEVLASTQLIDGLSSQIPESIIPLVAQLLPISRGQVSLNESLQVLSLSLLMQPQLS